MTDEPDNVVLVLLRRIDRTVAAHTEDLAEIRGRLGILEEHYASLSRRLDRIGPAIDRIIRRNVADANQATINPVQPRQPQQRKPKEPAPDVMQQPPQQPKEPAPDPKTVEWDQRLHQMVQNAEPGNAREALKTILDTLRRAWRDLPTQAKSQLIPSIEKYTILAEAIDHEHERTHAGVQS